jgi:hypothetical protein
MTSIRDYEEQQFLENLRKNAEVGNAIRASFVKRIESAYENEHNAIERSEMDLHRTYEIVPAMLAKISELSGIDQDMLITIIGQTAVGYQNISFSLMANLLRDFYVIKNRIEREGK